MRLSHISWSKKLDRFPNENIYPTNLKETLMLIQLTLGFKQHLDFATIRNRSRWFKCRRTRRMSVRSGGFRKRGDRGRRLYVERHGCRDRSGPEQTDRSRSLYFSGHWQADNVKSCQGFGIEEIKLLLLFLENFIFLCAQCVNIK